MSDQPEHRAATRVVGGERQRGVPQDALPHLERMDEVGDRQLLDPL